MPRQLGPTDAVTWLRPSDWNDVVDALGVGGAGDQTVAGVLNVTPPDITDAPHAFPPAALNVVGFEGQDPLTDLVIAVTGNGDGFTRVNWDASVQIAADGASAINLLEVGDNVDNVLVVSAAATTAVAIQGREDNQIGLDVRGVTGLTEPLIYAATQGGGVFFIRPTGAIVFKATQPADADVPTGYCALWFDPTNGAAKLMIKAKQADGTVRTGQVALT